MKYLILIFTAITIHTYSMIAVSAERFRAHYEVNVDNGLSVRTVRTSCFITPGTPVVHDIGESRLSMTVEVGQADEYTLTLALSPAAIDSGADAALVSQAFKGRLAGPSNGPLEFNTEAHGLKIHGAISLSTVSQ